MAGCWVACSFSVSLELKKSLPHVPTMPCMPAVWYAELDHLGVAMRYVARSLLLLASGVAALAAAPIGRAPDNPVGRDRHGDRLPSGAIARLGTVRFRGQLQRGTDGKSLATLRGNRATLIDPATGAEVKQLPGPDANEFEAANFLLSPDGQMLAYGGGDRVEIWEATGRQRHVIRFDNDVLAISGLDMQPTLFVPRSASLIIDRPMNDAGISCWSVNTGERLWTYHQGVGGNEASCRTVGLGPDGTTIVTVVTQQNSAHALLLASETGDIRHTIDLGVNINANEVAVSPNGRLLLVPDNATGEIHRRELPNGRELGVLAGTSRGGTITFSVDGKRIVVADDSVRIFGAATGKEETKLRGFGGIFGQQPNGLMLNFTGANGQSTVVFSGDEKTVWTAQLGSPIWRCFDSASGREKKLPNSGHASQIHCVAATRDGKQFITAGMAEHVCIWESSSGELIRRLGNTAGSLFALNSDPVSIAVCPDGKTVAVKTDANRIQLWDTTTGRVRKSLPIPDDTSPGIAYSPDGKTIVVGPGSNGKTEESFVRILDAATGNEIRKFPSAYTHSSMIAFSSDGRWIAVGMTNPEGTNSLNVLDTTSGRTQRTMEGSTDAEAFLPFGDLLAYSTTDEIIVTEIGAFGHRLKITLPGNEQIDLLAVSPDGRILAGANNGSGSRKIYLWDLRTGAELPPLIGHDNFITALAFAQNGRLISGSADTTALIWEMQNRATAVVETLKMPEEWSGAWADLAGEAAGAHIAIERLLASGPLAIEWLRKHLKPAIPIDATRIQWLLERLNADHFNDRQKAAIELEKFDRQVEPHLRRHLDTKLSAEARRRTARLIEGLDNPAADPERLRESRCLELLQRMNNEAAKKMLAEFAKGDPAARLTQSAQRILARVR
jgi:WD40 repeat protein